jgi:hypothetical protein
VNFQVKILSAAVLLCVVAQPLHAAAPNAGFEGCAIATDQDLDQMRGGFGTHDDSLSFNFGIERAVFVDGQLVSTTTIVIPTNFVNSPVMPAHDLGSIKVIQNGSGNIFNLQGVQNFPGAVMTVIQNSMDNQDIVNATIINAKITSQAFLNSLAVQSSLNQMVFTSLH